MTKLEAINTLVKDLDNLGEVSDGYHTFNELYEHRFQLYLALCRIIERNGGVVWKSKKHSDNTMYKGWFVLGINIQNGNQITYHLPMDKWHECHFVALPKAPPYDGHTSDEVLQRLKTL